MILIFGVILFISSFIELFLIKKTKFLFWILAIIMTVCLCIRYGQGTDYFGYYYNFNVIGTPFQELFFTQSHGELLWRISQAIFKQFNLSFELFVFVIALISMLLTLNSINKYSPLKIFSLFLLYPTYYLTYYVSGMREGLAIALFLSIGIDLLKKKKQIKYIILILILSLIHTSAIALIVLPLFIYKQNINWKKFILPLVFLVVLGFSTGIFNVILKNIFNRAMRVNVNISILGILIRIILFIIITILYKMYKKEGNDSDEGTISMLYSIYKIGFIISLLLCFNSLYSQRITAYFKATEVIIIPFLIKKCNQINFKDVLLYCIVILSAFSIEMYKNIDAALVQGDYYDWVTPYNMPYVTVYNKEEISKYRNNRLMKEID